MIVADINKNGGKQTVDAMPESMKFHNTNVAKETDWKLLVEATQDAFGRIDCLVNNAGTTYKNKVRERLLTSNLCSRTDYVHSRHSK